jgi:hypothetical protein
MAETKTASRVAGKTFRFAWKDGPTGGKTHEHVFNTDGSVSYGQVEAGAKPQKYTTEKQYAAMDVADDVVLVSYLAASGYTLTVAMNFANHTLIGIASNDKQWFPITGTFQDA